MKRAHTVRTVIDRAKRNGNVITRREALAVGANTRQLTELVRAGILLRPYPGVYVLAGAADDHRVEVRAAMAGVWASVRRGADAQLGRATLAAASHGTAAWLQGIIDRPPGAVHITTPLSARRLRGVVVHRSVQPFKPLAYAGIRCTPPVLTLIDLAADSTPDAIAPSVDRALANRLVRINDLRRGLAEWGGKRGTGYLRVCLAERGYTGAPHPSVLESAMGRLLRRMGLPAPEAEVHAGPDGRYRIDFVYRARRVAVEVYGYAWHHSPEQLTADMARQRQLTLEGWTVLIYTWQDIERDPERVTAEIAAAIRVEAAVG